MGIMMRRLAIFIFFAAVILVFTGCVNTTITSEPPGAEVRLNGRFLGDTPFECKIKQGLGLIGNRYRFTASKEGYNKETKDFYESPTMNVTEVVPKKIHFKLIPAKKTPAADEDAQDEEQDGPIEEDPTADVETPN